MPKRAQKVMLNDVRVKNAKPDVYPLDHPRRPGQPKRRMIWDAVMPNFGLQVSRRGAKSWYVVAPNKLTRKQVWVCLGSYPLLGLGDARKAAGEALGDLQSGKLPRATLEAQARQATTQTFAAYAAQYERRALPGLAAGTQRHNKRALGRVLKEIGPLPIMDVRRSMILKVLREIQAASGNASAHVALIVTGKVFSLAAAELDDLISPVPGIKAEHYQIRREGEGDRDRVLDDDELVRVWNAAGEMGYPYAPLYRLLSLLGLRRDELGSAEWDWVDWDKKVLNIPSSKGGIPLTVPLSPRCLEIFKGIPRIQGQTSIFGRPRGWSRAKARLDAACGVTDWVTHDLRRTLRSGLGRLGVNFVVAEMALGHKQSGIAGVYDRYSYLDERRGALLKWEQLVMGLVDPSSKVVPIRA